MEIAGRSCMQEITWSVDEECVNNWYKNRLPILLKEFKKE